MSTSADQEEFDELPRPLNMESVCSDYRNRAATHDHVTNGTNCY